MSAIGQVIRFWMRKVRDLRTKLALANSDYADLRIDFDAVNELYLQKTIDCHTLTERVSDLQVDSLVERIRREEADQRIEELEAELGRSEDRRYRA